MKKLIITSALFSSVIIFAQNTGIGTTAPTEKLDVAGNIKSREIFNTAASPAESKTVAVAADGVLKTKPLPPENAAGDYLLAGTTYTTDVSSVDFAPSVIKFVPYGGVLGYYFSVVNNIWQITVTPSDGISYGQQYAEIEILWLNK